MKKAISLFLAILMVFSCFGAVFASAADDGFTNEDLTNEELTEVDDAMNYFMVNNLPERFDESIKELRVSEASKAKKDRINLIGMDLEFLYSNTDALMWSFLDVYKTDADGNFVYDETGKRVMKITKGEVALMFSSINSYINDLFYVLFGGLDLYTVENAIFLANTIGSIFFRDFEKLDVNNFSGLFGNEVPNSQEFFEAVVELSGLDIIIQQNWCTRGRDFCQPVVEAMGGKYTNIHVDNYANGKELGARVLEGMFAEMKIVGPVAFFVDLIVSFSRSYETIFRDPVLALFSQKTEKILNYEYISEYQTFSGLIKLMFCDCDPLKGEGCFAGPVQDVEHFCPVEFPTKRIATATDNDEVMIYLFYYFNLCGVHRANKAYINTLKDKINNSKLLFSTQKNRVNSILDGFFLNNIDSTTKTLIEPYIQEALQPSPNGILDRLKNSLQVFLKKIADYFEYLRKLFSGELNYGEGGSPFI